MIMRPRCVRCLREKWIDRRPDGADAALVAAYRARVEAAIAEKSPLYSSPEMDAELINLYEEIFGEHTDYAPIKRRYNALMLAREPEMNVRVDAAPDPLERAVQISMTGNYIDFATQDDVNEAALDRLLADSDKIPVDPSALNELRHAAKTSKSMLFMTDNCGEIVTDKVLIRAIKALNSELSVTAMVRGGDIVNDATIEDAEQVGLGEAADAVVGSGCALAGNPLHKIDAAARRAIDEADFIVAKGQANYEALNGLGLPAFYIFMCKCELFMERFNAPRFAGMLTREDF